MRKLLLCLAIASTSFIVGCGENDARVQIEGASPPSSLAYETLIKVKLQERNKREGTDFDVAVEAERMRQRYIKLSDEEKVKAYEDASEM